MLFTEQSAPVSDWTGIIVMIGITFDDHALFIFCRWSSQLSRHSVLSSVLCSVNYSFLGESLFKPTGTKSPNANTHIQNKTPELCGKIDKEDTSLSISAPFSYITQGAVLSGRGWRTCRQSPVIPYRAAASTDRSISPKDFPINLSTLQDFKRCLSFSIHSLKKRYKTLAVKAMLYLNRSYNKSSWACSKLFVNPNAKLWSERSLMTFHEWRHFIDELFRLWRIWSVYETKKYFFVYVNQRCSWPHRLPKQQFFSINKL